MIKKALVFSTFSLLLLSLTVVISCNGLDKTTTQTEHTDLAESEDSTEEISSQTYIDPFRDLHAQAQLMLVMRRIFQDSQGNLWFVGDGVFCYRLADQAVGGDSLVDFSENEVFSRDVVRHVREDIKGNLWFATSNGIVKYNSSAKNPSFTRFTQEDGLIGRDIWSMTIDRKGIIWTGTLAGVTQFDPEKTGQEAFTLFDLPETEIDSTRGVTSERIVHSIIEDRKGQIWFATNGGAYIFDPTVKGDLSKSLSHISEEDGLCHKVINDILEDKSGNIWFATHHNGVCRLNLSEPRNGELAFTDVSAKADIKGTEAWSLFEDQAGNIWFPIEHEGVYRYSPSGEMTNFYKEDGLEIGNVHSMLEDRDGNYWLGGFGGLYRYTPSEEYEDGKGFENITKADGPWNKE